MVIIIIIYESNNIITGHKAKKSLMCYQTFAY